MACYSALKRNAVLIYATWMNPKWKKPDWKDPHYTISSIRNDRNRQIQRDRNGEQWLPGAEEGRNEETGTDY